MERDPIARYCVDEETNDYFAQFAASQPARQPTYLEAAEPNGEGWPSAVVSVLRTAFASQ